MSRFSMSILNLFTIMQAPPRQCAKLSTRHFLTLLETSEPLCARSQGPRYGARAGAQSLIGLGLFFAETNGNQNMGNARSNTYKGEVYKPVHPRIKMAERNGQQSETSISAFDPASERSRRQGEEARVGNLGSSAFNHWTAVKMPS